MSFIAASRVAGPSYEADEQRHHHAVDRDADNDGADVVHVSTTQDRRNGSSRNGRESDDRLSTRNPQSAARHSAG